MLLALIKTFSRVALSPFYLGILSKISLGQPEQKNPSAESMAKKLHLQRPGWVQGYPHTSLFVISQCQVGTAPPGREVLAESVSVLSVHSSAITVGTRQKPLPPSRALLWGLDGSTWESKGFWESAVLMNHQTFLEWQPGTELWELLSPR